MTLKTGRKSKRLKQMWKRTKQVMMAKRVMITRAAQEAEVTEMAAPIEQHEALQDPNFKLG